MKIASILSSTAYRGSILILTSFLAMFIFYVSNGTRPRIDAVPSIQPITPAKYNEWAQYADILRSGIIITNLAVSDFPQGLFILDAFVWFQFNPLVFSLDTVSQFTVDKGRIMEKEFVESIKVGEEVLARYRVRFEVKSNLDFRYFPLDAHRIYMVIKYDKLAPSEVILTSDFTRVWFGDDAVSFNWSYGEPACDFGYIEHILDSRDAKTATYTSAAAVYFDFGRATVREAMLVLVPFVILLFIVLSSLLMATLTSFHAVIIAGMGILGMLIQRLIISHMSPMTSYYMLSDWIFFLVVTCVLFVMFFELLNVHDKNEDELSFQAMRGGALTFSALLFLVGWFYLLYLW